MLHGVDVHARYQAGLQARTIICVSRSIGLKTLPWRRMKTLLWGETETGQTLSRFALWTLLLRYMEGTPGTIKRINMLLQSLSP